MKRYEWKVINETLNWWGLYDNVRREFVIETTKHGMEAYKRMGL